MTNETEQPLTSWQLAEIDHLEPLGEQVLLYPVLPSATASTAQLDHPSELYLGVICAIGDQVVHGGLRQAGPGRAQVWYVIAKAHAIRLGGRKFVLCHADAILAVDAMEYSYLPAAQ